MKHSALFVHASPRLSGCEAYRMWIPVVEMRKHGMDVEYAHIEAMRIQAQQAYFRNLPGPGRFSAYVFPRMSITDGWQLDDLRTSKKRFVFEVDDDFTNQYREVINDRNTYRTVWNFAVNIADAITVSTPYLARAMRERVGKHKPIFVIPNAVDLSAWQGIAKPEKLTIGLTGSPTHYDDWRVLETVLPEILKRYPDVQLLLAGFVPDYTDDLSTSFPNQVSVKQGWMDYRDYIKVAAQAHIVLCPVDPGNRFNWSKSSIKAVEGMAHGGVPVATDMNIYADACAGGRGMLVPFRPEAWQDAISTLIESPDLREKMADRGRKYVSTHHAIGMTWGLWKRAIEKVMEA